MEAQWYAGRKRRARETLIAQVDKATSAHIVICPPFVYLQQVAGLISNVPLLYWGRKICQTN